MGVWIKLFEDGSSEHGSDRDIVDGKASWSRGRLVGIQSVYINDKRNACVLRMPKTEWHQYDRYLSMISPGEGQRSIRSARVVQAKIKKHHVGKSIRVANHGRSLTVELTDKNLSSYIFITKDNIGSWVTMYTLVNGIAGVEISERGAFNGDKQVLK